mgnify:CR=1 FL=1
MIVSERLRRVVATVFGAPVEEINAATSPDNLGRWDSLHHLNLIIALEEEFGVSICPEDSDELLTVGIIQLFLEEKGAALGQTQRV